MNDAERIYEEVVRYRDENPTATWRDVYSGVKTHYRSPKVLELSYRRWKKQIRENGEITEKLKPRNSDGVRGRCDNCKRNCDDLVPFQGERWCAGCLCPPFAVQNAADWAEENKKLFPSAFAQASDGALDQCDTVIIRKHADRAFLNIREKLKEKVKSEKS